MHWGSADQVKRYSSSAVEAFTGSSCRWPAGCISHMFIRKPPADVYFPKIDMRIWKVVEKTGFISEDETKIPYSYVIYERKRSGK